MTINLYALTCTLAMLVHASNSACAAVIAEQRTREFDAVVGGWLSDDDADGVFDHAAQDGFTDRFTVGGGHSWTGSVEGQGSFEFDLGALATQLPENDEILSVHIKLTLSSLGAISTTPNILGIVGGYIGDGAFGLSDADLGSQVGTFWVWNHNLVSPPYEAPVIDVTDFFLSSRTTGEQFIGFNFRPSSLPNGSVTNGYYAPHLEVTWLVPEPSSALFLLFGGITAMLRRRRLG